MKKKVFVAMSGGVDSSVAAALLKKQGYDVVGVFMKNWTLPINGKNYCPWVEDSRDARRVTDFLGIPFYILDFEEEYKKAVVDYFFNEYQAGRTPNPDVMCNKEIKFGLFLERALALGADYIATGHYARVASVVKSQKSEVKSGSQKLKLLRGIDENKDQSYFLWTLTQDQLKQILFPIGDYKKSQVRQMACQFGLPLADKKDSQGICFIGPVNVNEFLKTKIKPRKGKVKTIDGKVIGEHDGVWFYTIGQRHGFSHQGARPMYVVDKDVKNNILIASSDNDALLNRQEMTASNLSFVNGGISDNQVQIQVRYRQTPQAAKIQISKNQAQISFFQPVRAVTPGQSMVIYKGEELMGGGIIN